MSELRESEYAKCTKCAKPFWCLGNCEMVNSKKINWKMQGKPSKYHRNCFFYKRNTHGVSDCIYSLSDWALGYILLMMSCRAVGLVQCVSFLLYFSVCRGCNSRIWQSDFAKNSNFHWFSTWINALWRYFITVNLYCARELENVEWNRCKTWKMSVSF